MDEHFDTIHLALSRRVKSTISKTATCKSFSFTLPYNINVMKAWLLLAAMHMLHLFISTFQTSIEYLEEEVDEME